MIIVFLLSVGLPLDTLAGSKLLATSGLTQIEGSGGGGIVPWAIIAGYGSDDEVGAAISVNGVEVDDFRLKTASISIGINNRLELSAARQKLEVKPLNLDIHQDILGVKYRLFGDIVYNTLPQVSLGIQYKKNRDADIPTLLGANDDEGIDYYLSATKVFLAGAFGKNILLNGTIRRTSANQMGLLGFGNHSGNNYDVVGEVSAAFFINRRLALGAEYRQKPNNLRSVDEDDWMDIFIAYFPNKRLSMVIAYSDLGDIAGLTDQSGIYFSFQLTH